jgi:hypothetical protein
MKIDRATEDRRFFMVAFHLRQDERLARSHRLPHRLVLDSLLYEELIIVDDFWGEVLAPCCHGALVRRTDGEPTVAR